MMTFRLVEWLRAWLVVTLAALLVACGGGNGATNTSSGDASPDTGSSTLDGGSMDTGGGGMDSGGPEASHPPFIGSFTATPATVPFGGGSTTLTWSVTGATSITIDNGVGDVTNIASRSVMVTMNTTFTLTAKNAAGSTTQTTTVSVAGDPNSPIIVSFTHTSGPPVGGGPVTLAWQVTGATSLSIDQGVGDVTGKTSTNVNVLNDTTFTLTATNVHGSTSAQTAIAVQAPAYLLPIVQTSAGATLDFGSPYDSIIGAPVLGATTAAVAPATSCTGSTWCPVAAPGINSFDEQVRLIETDSDYLSTLEISASVDVNAGAFSGSDKFDYFSSHQLDSKSVYLWVEIRRVGQAQEITNLHIDPTASLLDPVSFFHKYGDRYAYLAVTGSELYGLLQIQTQTVTDKRSITNSLTTSISGIKGGVTVSNTVKSTLDTVLTNTSITADIRGSGFQGAIPVYDPTTSSPSTFITALENAENSQTSGMLNTNIRYYYTHYLGLPGYPGLPPNVANLVAQYAAGQADWLQYNAVTTKADDFGHYFTTQVLSPYVAQGSILATMKSHVGDMVTWINGALGDSLALTAAPTIAPTAALETFAKITETPSSNTNGISWNAHTLTNGFLPYSAADYEIAARYADDNGNLNGVPVDFRKYQPTTDIANTSTEYPFELYSCNEIVNGNLTPSVAFAWSNQLGEFHLDNSSGATFLDAKGNITNAGNLAGLLESEETINPYEYYNNPSGNTMCTQGTCEAGNRRFVIMSMATGQAMTTVLASGWGSGSGQNATATAFSNQPGQWWGFTPQGSTPNTFTIVNDQVGLIHVQSFVPTDEGYLLNLAGNAPYTAGTTVIAYQNVVQRPDGNSVLQLFHNADGYSSLTQPLGSATSPTWVIGIPPAGGSTCSSNCFPEGTPLQIVAANGYVNEKWLYMPAESLYIP
jgi:hypothetical protein